MDGWDMKFQIECANAFKKWTQLKLLDQEHCDSLMKLACEYIESNIEVAVEEEENDEDCVSVQYVKAWMELFVELAGSVSSKVKFIPTMKYLVDFKKKIPLRKYGVDLIVKVSLRYDEKFIMTHLKDMILFWWRDMNWNIRLSICEHISKICKKMSKKNWMELLYTEIVEFLNDVEILVRLTAIEEVLEIFDMLEDEQIDNDFIPVVKMHLNLDIDDSWNYRMSKNIGKIIFNLQNSLDDSTGINEMCYDYCKQLLEYEDPEIRLNVWYNIPGLYYVFNNEDIDFISLLENFSVDKDQAIRMQLAKWFHEIVSISKSKGNCIELKDIFFSLLTDDDLDIQKLVIKNLDEYLKNFFKSEDRDFTPNSRDSSCTDDESDRIRYEFFNEWIEHLLSVGDHMAIRNPQLPQPKLKGMAMIPLSASSWRTKIIFYQKLIDLFDLFQQENMKEAFWDAAKFDFLNGTEPLRRICAVFLTKVINAECLASDRDEMIEELIEELQHGSFSQRRSLLEFYEHSLEILTKCLWMKHWYKRFWQFSNDKIPTIRIRFAKSAQNIYKKLTKKDSDIDFMDQVETLLEDMWEDVQEAGIKLNSLIIKGYDSSKEQELLEIENHKKAYEQALREREEREKEEIQRRKDEEKEKKDYMDMLTDQMRMKKRYLKLPGFQTKLFSKESSHSKGRSRKRSSFTVGNRSKTSKSSSSKKGDSNTPGSQSTKISFSGKMKSMRS